MPKYDYDLIVIGGGAAGFVSSKLANGLGKKVALIEKERLGGDCTNYGCIPSKALIRASSMAHHMKHLKQYGLHMSSQTDIDTNAVMTHVRSVVQKVYEGHSADNFRKLGIDVLSGAPRFIDAHSVVIDDKVFSSRRFLIATGSRAFVPPIEGLQSAPYLTNKTFFDLERLPKSMIVLGGGPIGTELASALSRLGVEVTIVEMGERLLMREDGELVRILTERLAQEGVRIMTKAKAIKFSQENGKIVLAVESENLQKELKADTVLVAVGRTANVEGLNLEKAGVRYTEKGILTDASLQTTAPGIYACGDVVGPYQFSHMAEYQAVIATRNAFFPLKRKARYENAAWCTFTDPELAHAGLTEKEAKEKYGDRVRIYRHEYKDIDRARTDVSEIGMSKFICDLRGRLLGAHILGSRAGELIHEVQLARSMGIPFYKLYSVIHIYPTYTDAVKQPSKLCYIDRLGNNVFLKMLRVLLGKKK